MAPYSSVAVDRLQTPGIVGMRIVDFFARLWHLQSAFNNFSSTKTEVWGAMNLPGKSGL